MTYVGQKPDHRQSTNNKASMSPVFQKATWVPNPPILTSSLSAAVNTQPHLHDASPASPLQIVGRGAPQGHTWSRQLQWQRCASCQRDCEGHLGRFRNWSRGHARPAVLPARDWICQIHAHSHATLGRQAHLLTWPPGHPGHPGHLATLVTWSPGHLATWPPGHLATWPPGHLATWPPGTLDT